MRREAVNRDCVFCKIINGEIPGARVYEDDQCLAIPDLHPQAPVHLLELPKQQFASM
ncbi:MAG: HIT domain-containing protein, partial [Clostridiales bacterium]|nr:HIT domain-containing protein [Clostridiales bacterium]